MRYEKRLIEKKEDIKSYLHVRKGRSHLMNICSTSRLDIVNDWKVPKDALKNTYVVPRKVGLISSSHLKHESSSPSVSKCCCEDQEEDLQGEEEMLFRLKNDEEPATGEINIMNERIREEKAERSLFNNKNNGITGSSHFYSWDPSLLHSAFRPENCEWSSLSSCLTSFRLNQSSQTSCRLLLMMVLLLTPSSLLLGPASAAGNSKLQQNVKCDFQKYPSGGCSDQQTASCDVETETCVCRTGYPVAVNGRCFAYRDISDLCVTSRQCVKIKGKCIDNAGEEVVTNDSNDMIHERNSIPSLDPSSLLTPVRLNVGICKCPEGSFYSLERRECLSRILGRKCFFNTDCFSRSHSYCDGSKCKCKNGFFQDYVSDECKPSLVTLCIYGSTTDSNGTQRCRTSPKLGADDGTPGGNYSGSSNHHSSLSALFWPVIAFFLVILLLRMLKEGMKRDCERAVGGMAGASSDRHIPHGINSSGGNHGASGGQNNRRTRRSGGRSVSSSHRILSSRHPHHSRPNFIRHYPISDLLPPSVLQTSSASTVPDGQIQGRRSTGTTSGISQQLPPEIIVLMPPPPYSAQADPSNTSNNMPHHHPISDNPPPPIQISSTSTLLTIGGIPEEPPSYEEATRK